MDGSNARPCASGSTVGTPLRTVATSELVVPRSMPTAARCSCGAGDWPGSEICRSAMPLAGLQALHLLHRLVGGVDLGFHLLEELELAHEIGRARIVLLAVDRFAEALFQRAPIFVDALLQPLQGAEVLGAGGRL